MKPQQLLEIQIHIENNTKTLVSLKYIYCNSNRETAAKGNHSVLAYVISHCHGPTHKVLSSSQHPEKKTKKTKHTLQSPECQFYLLKKKKLSLEEI